MLLKSDTVKIQQDLAKYCRDGIMPDLPGANADRLPHYRRLVYNVIFGLMEQAYPITYSLLSIPEFKSLINAFFNEYDPQSPQVWKVPGELFQYVDQSDLPVKDDHPYLRDLMQMEWSEILVYNRENRDLPSFTTNEISDDNSLALNPNADVLSLKYPVFKGNWDEITNYEGDYRLLLFRNSETFKVHFLEITALHEFFIEKLKEGLILSESISQSLDHFGLEITESSKQILLSFAERLQKDGFVLGVLKSA